MSDIATTTTTASDGVAFLNDIKHQVRPTNVSPLPDLFQRTFIKISSNEAVAVQIVL